MNTTLSPQQIRLVAVLGMLVVVVGAGMFMLGRQKQDSTTQSPLPLHHARTATAPATTAHPRAATTKSRALPTTKAQARTHKPLRIATHGLPLAVAKALRRHRLVVVSLVTPGVDVDHMARAEAAAAASSTRAGFVSLNVFKQADGAPLLKKLGLLEAPAVLVVTRPARIFAELKGFADRDTVAQAVADARR
jgi:hypothetical protein